MSQTDWTETRRQEQLQLAAQRYQRKTIRDSLQEKGESCRTCTHFTLKTGQCTKKNKKVKYYNFCEGHTK